MADKRDVAFYLRQLTLADKEEKNYRDQAERTIKVYNDEDREGGPTHFNILWSNVETQLPALYSATPKQDVRRRYEQGDPLSRSVSELIDRSLSYAMDSGNDYSFDRFAELCVLDYVLPGRMVGRVKYEPIFEGVGEDRRKVGEYVYPHHVPWKHYRQSPSACWEDVWWVAYGDNFLSRDEIIAQYGRGHKDAPLTFADEEGEVKEDTVQKAQIWQIWDRQAGRVVEVIKGYDKFLDDYEPKLKFRDFFPQPEPALIIETPNSLVPIPEYRMYQYQARELNDVTKRISVLTRSMKAKGFYPGDETDKLDDFLKSDETILTPVEDWAGHAEKGGVKGMIDWMPVDQFIQVWEKLLLRRNLIIHDIFELTGISDIQRGSSDARETKGAQMLKANFGNRRFIKKQRRIQKFMRDVLRLMAEAMSEHYSAETFQQMTGIPVTDDMLKVLRDDGIRSYAIDIETDSTIEPDDQLEKQGAAEFLSAMSNYLAVAGPIVQSQPKAVEPLGSILLWMTRKFKIARPIEADIEKFIATYQALPQDRNSEAESKAAEVQSRLQIKMMEAQAEQQRLTQVSAAEQQRKQMETAADIRRKDAESQAKIQVMLHESQVKTEIDAKEAQVDMALKQQKVGSDMQNQAVKTEADVAAKAAKAGDRKVVPISDAKKTFSIDRDAQGEMMGGSFESGGVRKRFSVGRDEQGNIVGGEIVPVVDNA